ncbi:MAG: hypothetical protein HY722_08290 [Planctomycetes bacterium]|nr:hypothetical protein [Planctomycetota bacterium]
MHLRPFGRGAVRAAAVVAIYTCCATAEAETTSGSGSQKTGDGWLGSVMNSRVILEREWSKAKSTESVQATHAAGAALKVLQRSYRAFGLDTRVKGEARTRPQDSGFRTSVGLDVGWNRFGVHVLFQRTVTVASVGVQVFVGPVPVWVEAGAALWAYVKPTAGLRWDRQGVYWGEGVVSQFSVGVTVTAAVGIALAHVGVEGFATPFQVLLPLSLDFFADRSRVKADFVLRAYAHVALVVKVWVWKYAHRIAWWEHPYYARPLLDRTFLR